MIEDDASFTESSSALPIRVAVSPEALQAESDALFLVNYLAKLPADVNSLLLQANKPYPCRMRVAGQEQDVVLIFDHHLACQRSKRHPNKWIIDVAERKLGQGATAEVYATTTLEVENQCFHLRGDKRRVVKLFYHGMLEIGKVNHEFQCLNQLGDKSRKAKPPIKPLAFDDGELAPKVALVLREVPGDTLQNILRHQRDGKSESLNLEQIFTIILGLLVDAEKISLRGIVHRDLKPGNIICDLSVRPPQVSIIDLGLATHCNAEQPESVGTMGYLAPSNSPKAETSFDVYSLAIIIAQILKAPQLNYTSIGGTISDGYALMFFLLDYKFQDVFSNNPPELAALNSMQRFVIRTILSKLGAQDPAERIPLAIAIYCFEKIAQQLNLLVPNYQTRYLQNELVGLQYEHIVKVVRADELEAVALAATRVGLFTPLGRGAVVEIRDECANDEVVPSDCKRMRLGSSDAAE